MRYPPSPSGPPPPLPRWQGVLALLLIATLFASNHVAARLAFEQGATVATAVLIRSIVTMLVLLTLLRLAGRPFTVEARMARRIGLVGLLLTVQSYCLYAAVSRLPVSLALLTFNIFPILLAALSWATGSARPSSRTLIAMPVILAGPALALDVLGLGATPIPISAQAGADGAPPSMIPGVAFALTASLAFATAMLLTTRWLNGLDGRLRTGLLMATVAAVVLVAGLVIEASGLSARSAGGSGPILGPVFGLPRNTTGWLGLGLLSLLYGVAFGSLFALLPRLGAVNNTPILNFEPIAAMGLGVLILDQPVGWLQLAGALLVIGGIAWIASGKSR